MTEFHTRDTFKAGLISQGQTTVPAPTQPTDAATKAYADSVLPTGMISPFAGSTAPAGWLLCDGLAVSRTTYSALFAVCGVAYGVGNGSSTFNLPDLKGRIPVGYYTGLLWANAMGKQGGEDVHILTTAEMPGHTHPVEMAPGTGAFRQDGAQMGGANNRFALAEGGAYMYAMPTGGGQPHNNNQFHTITQYIIKT